MAQHLLICIGLVGLLVAYTELIQKKGETLDEKSNKI